MDDRRPDDTPLATDDSGPAPKVSVSIITYKHEKFIGEALDSIFMQEIDFPIEIVIGEDCSPDRTREIILGYADKYPGVIKLSNYESNVGGFTNAVATLGRCRGEYVCSLDGDDFWTSPKKLKTQVALLDANPDASMCFHAHTYHFMDSRPPEPIYPLGRKPRYQLADLHQWIRAQTSTMMFRRSMWSGIPPEWVKELMYGDWTTQILLAEKGDLLYIDEIMGAYRRHEGAGFHAMLDPTTTIFAEQVIMTLDRVIEHLGDERAKPFELARGRALYRLAHLSIDLGEREKAREALSRAVSAHGYDASVGKLEPMRSYAHLYAPSAYRLIRSALGGRKTSTAPQPGGAG